MGGRTLAGQLACAEEEAPRTPQRFYVLFDRSEDHWKLTVYGARAATAYLWDSGIPDYKDPNRAREARRAGARTRCWRRSARTRTRQGGG